MRISAVFAIVAVSSSLLPATSCAGKIVGWGSNSTFMFAGVPLGACTTGMVQVTDSDLDCVVAVTGGRGLALCSDGRLHGWLFPNSEIPQPPKGLDGLVAIASGAMHGLALRNDSTVMEWDVGRSGKLTMPQGLSNIVAIAADAEHSLALRRDGSVVAWGRTRPPSNLSNIVAIAATKGWQGNNLAIRNDGKVLEWNNGNGRPSLVQGVSNAIAVASGEAHQLALRVDGTVFGWGFNGSGEATGTPTTSEPYSAAGLVTIDGTVLTNIARIAAGSRYSLALRKDGTVVAWGRNWFNLTDVPAGLSNVVAIVAGGDYCLAVTTNNTVAERFRR